MKIEFIFRVEYENKIYNSFIGKKILKLRPWRHHITLDYIHTQQAMLISLKVFYQLSRILQQSSASSTNELLASYSNPNVVIYL